MRAEVEVGATNKLISAPRGNIVRSILQKLKVFSVVMTDERHGTTPAHQADRIEDDWLVVLGKKSQALVRLSPNKEMKRIVATDSDERVR